MCLQRHERNPAVSTHRRKGGCPALVVEQGLKQARFALGLRGGAARVLGTYLPGTHKKSYDSLLVRGFFLSVPVAT
jgi:hypothetical protein